MTSEQLLDRLREALVDRYVIERELGRGGMATVYLARDVRHERLVALKVLRSDLGAVLGPERFAREIKLAAGLQHPHIVSVYDSGVTATGQLWFTMPHVEGESLRDRLRRQRQLPLDDALRITREIALALDYAHRHRVIHRDIKPENILLVDGQAMVADFGVARALTGGRPGNTLTQTGIAIGTPAYMSPEQAAGEHAVESASDVYSLGVVLYEMLAGEPPYTGPTAQAIAAKMMAGEPPSVRRTRPSVPPVVDQAIHKALSPVPADRYTTAADFARALETGQTAAIASTQGPHQRRRRVISASLAAAVVVALLIGGAYVRHSLKAGTGAAARSDGPIRLAVLPFDNLGDSADAYFADGVTDAVRGKLTSLPGLEVIGSSSSALYRRTTKTPQQIGQELGVRYLLVGKVRWARGTGRSRPPSRVQVSPELIDATSAADRWEQPFDAPLTDVFQVQADIAGKVAQQLQITLSPTTKQTLDRPPTVNLDAYDAYLRGRDIQRESDISPTVNGRAAAAFTEAVRRDSTFALAWAALSEARALVYSFRVPAPADAEAAQRAASRALVLAPDLPEARSAQGSYYRLVRHDNARALVEYEAGLRLSPNNAVLLSLVAETERLLGRWDAAVAHHEQAVRLDPRNNRVANRLCFDQLILRRVAAARAACDRALALEPRNLSSVAFRARVALLQGDLAGAHAVMRAASPAVDSAALVAYMSDFGDLVWALDSAQERTLLALPPSAFDGDRGAWGFALAQAYTFKGDQLRSRAYADSARIAFEAELKVAASDAELHALHGVVLAYLGRNSEAVAEGERAVSLLPISMDSFDGAYMVHQLVRIYILVGEHEKALDQLQRLLSVPYFVSTDMIRIDPNFAPLRGNPRFERLIAQPAAGERPTT